MHLTTSRFGILSLLALAPMTAAACAASPDESVESSTSAATTLPSISEVHASADAGSVTITYTRSFRASPFTIKLAGPSGTTTLPETSVNGATGAVFTQLDECTDFTWSVLSSSGVAMRSGVIHTLAPGNATCATAQTLYPNDARSFRGVYHHRFEKVWCDGIQWNYGLSTFPEGTGWHMSEEHNLTQPGQGGDSFTHFWNPGSQPFPCAEQAVDVQRSAFRWDLDASQVRRLQSATLHASFNNAVCATDFALIGEMVWPVTTEQTDNLNDYGDNWNAVLGAPGRALVRDSTIAPLTINGLQATADLTSVARTGEVQGGFAAVNDGFPIYTGLPGVQYAQDNDSCETGVINVTLATTLAALTPDTPLNCSLSTTCTGFDVTCDAAPELFELHQIFFGADTVIDFAQGSTTSGPSFVGDYNLKGSAYVCSVSQTSALRTCSPVMAAPVLSCGGGSSGGGGSGSSSGGIKQQ